MDRDVLRDDDPVQHTGRTRIGGCSAAAPAARKQRVGRDDDGRVLHVPVLLRFGDHLRLGQRHLPRKDLDALDADGAVPRLRGRQAAHRIGQTGGIVLLQREGTVRGGQGHVRGIALGVGEAGGGEAVAADGDGHTLDRAGLTGRKGLDAESSGVFHGDTLLCW